MQSAVRSAFMFQRVACVAIYIKSMSIQFVNSNTVGSQTKQIKKYFQKHRLGAISGLVPVQFSFRKPSKNHSAFPRVREPP